MHLVGVVAMFIASKFVDYSPLYMDFVHTNIAHQRFTKDEIKAKELEILKTINFDADLPTTDEFIEALCNDFACSHILEIESAEWKTFKRIKDRSIYFAVMCCYEYSMLRFKYFFFYTPRILNCGSYNKNIIVHLYWQLQYFT